MDLYFSYKNPESKKIIFYIYNNNLNKKYNINFLDTEFNKPPNNIKSVPLLVDHKNKKIINSTNIIKYLTNNVEHFQELDDNKMFNNFNEQKTNQQENEIKPFIPFENGTFQFYNFLN